MDKPYWTVGKVRDALEAFALVHQHSHVDSMHVLNGLKQLQLNVLGSDGKLLEFVIDAQGKATMVMNVFEEPR